jgi:hypothetical protein
LSGDQKLEIRVRTPMEHRGKAANKEVLHAQGVGVRLLLRGAEPVNKDETAGDRA